MLNRFSKRSLLVVLAPLGLVACQGMPPTKVPPTGPVPPLPNVPGAVGVLVLDAAGRIAVYTPDGKPVRPCQLPPRPPLATGTPPAGAQQPAPKAYEPGTCEKLINTTVYGVTPITVIEHTGSACRSIVVYMDGVRVTFPLC